MIKAEEQIVSLNDYNKFMSGEKNTRINEIWKNILNEMPEELKTEAEGKGFTLDELSRTSFDRSYIINIPNASKELQDYIRDNVYPHITCIID